MSFEVSRRLCKRRDGYDLASQDFALRMRAGAEREFSYHCGGDGLSAMPIERRCANHSIDVRDVIVYEVSLRATHAIDDL